MVKRTAGSVKMGGTMSTLLLQRAPGLRPSSDQCHHEISAASTVLVLHALPRFPMSETFRLVWPHAPEAFQRIDHRAVLLIHLLICRHYTLTDRSPPGDPRAHDTEDVAARREVTLQRWILYCFGPCLVR